MSGTSAGRKRLLLTPARDTQSGAKIELVRGEGPDMEDPQTFGTLHIDMTSPAEGDIELIFSLDEEGNVTASAGILGSPDRQELQGNLADLVDQPGFPTTDLEEMDLSTLDELEESPQVDLDEEPASDAFEFDLEEEPSQPKTDRQILDDDSLVGDGLDDFSFGEEETPAGGPVQGEDLGDLGDLGSFDDFSDFSDQEGQDEETPVSSSLEIPAEDGPTVDLSDFGSAETDQEEFTLPEMESLDDLGTPTGEESSLDSFGEVEDLTPVGESPLGDSRKSFEKGPDGFDLDLPFGLDEDTEGTPADSAGEDFSFDDMEMGSLDSDFGGSLDLDSGAGDITPEDFHLDTDFGAAAESDSGDADFEIPAEAPPAPAQKKSQGKAGKTAPAPGSEGVKVSGKIPLVLSLGTLVVLLGIFLGLLFLNMTRMTMVPPIQSLDLKNVSSVVAALEVPAPTLTSLPPASDDEGRKVLSLEYFGTPHFYRQFPLVN